MRTALLVFALGGFATLLIERFFLTVLSRKTRRHQAILDRVRGCY